MRNLLLKTVGLLVLWLSMVQLSAQSRFLRGKVTNEDSQAFEGVTVSAVGANYSQTTNASGEWSLAVSPNVKQIQFAAKGYLNKTVDIPAGSDIIDVRMEIDVLGINTITVTALGIKKEQRSLGVSNQQITGSEVQGSGEQNVVEGISSKVAGALVTGSGGTPGASSKVILRGATTFTNSSQPLIVIDGVPMDNSTDQSSAADYPFNPNLQGVNNSNRAIDINPDDIETINVLKGPAAAALYGVRGANGAIIITTKRGKMGGSAFTIDVNSTLDVSMVNKLPEKQRIYGQGNGGGTLDSNGHPIPEGSFAVTPNSWGPKAGKAYNNEDAFFRRGMNYTNNVGISVGGDKTTARFSFGNTNQTGNVPNSTFNRTTVRVNTDSKLGNRMMVGSSINLINSGGIRPQNGSNLAGIMLSLMRSPTDFNLGGGQGPKNYLNPDGSMYTYYPFYDNPYFSSYENTFKDNVNRMLGNVYLSYSPLDWITATWRIGTDQYTDSRKQLFAIGSNQPDNAPGGEIDENVLKYKEVYSDILINLHKNLSKDIDANITVGNNLNSRKSSDQYLRGRDLAVPGFYNLSNASNLYANSSESTIKTAALFLNAEFDYRKYLFLNVTARNEWASTFGTAKSSFLYPSANLAFVFTELMPGEKKILSFGKIRVAYAQAGVNPPAYATKTYYEKPFFTDGFTSGVSFPYLGQNGFGLSNTLGNSALKPEKTTGKEVGFDLRFFQGRLNLDLTLYNQKSSDILVSMPLAPSSGFQRVLQNSGEMTNKGVEAIVNASIIKMKNFGWDATVNFARNRNKVIKLAPGVPEIEIETGFASIGSYAIVGQPYGVLYGSRWQRTADGKLVIGSDGLPVIANTRGNIGNPYPKWYGGMRNTFHYKKVSLTFLWDVRKGGDIWNGTYARMNRLGVTKASENRNQSYIIDGVKASDGTPNNIAISPLQYYSTYLGDGGNFAAENAIQDGSWVRLRELGISYSIDTKSKKYIKKINLGIIGRNLLLFTKYKGVDPETSLTGAGSNIGGFDYFNNPGLKSYMFKLSFTI